VEATAVIKILKPELAILQKEEVERQGNIGRADESGYKLFKIGWIDLFFIFIFWGGLVCG
jgi:hypothetical protein